VRWTILATALGAADAQMQNLAKLTMLLVDRTEEKLRVSRRVATMLTLEHVLTHRRSEDVRLNPRIVGN
jgi:hypothetical protein